MRALLSAGFVSLIAWITHIVVCLNMGQWGFLIAGAIFFPIAVIHGLGIWLGVWPGLWW